MNRALLRLDLSLLRTQRSTKTNQPAVSSNSNKLNSSHSTVLTPLLKDHGNSLTISARDTAWSRTDKDNPEQAYYDDAIMQWFTHYIFKQIDSDIHSTDKHHTPQPLDQYQMRAAEKEPHWIRKCKPNNHMHSAIFAGTHSIKRLHPDTISDFFTHTRNDIKNNYQTNPTQTRTYQAYFQLNINRVHWVVMIININSDSKKHHAQKQDLDDIQSLTSKDFDPLFFQDIYVEIYDPMKASQDHSAFAHAEFENNTIITFIKQACNTSVRYWNRCELDRLQTHETFNCGPFCLEITYQLLSWYCLDHEINITPNSGGYLRKQQFTTLKQENKNDLIKALTTNAADEISNQKARDQADEKKNALIAEENQDKINALIEVMAADEKIIDIISLWKKGHCDNMPKLKSLLLETNNPKIISTLLKPSPESLTQQLDNELDKYELNTSSNPSYEIYLNELDSQLTKEIDSILTPNTRENAKTDKRKNTQLLTNYISSNLSNPKPNTDLLILLSKKITHYFIQSFAINQYSREVCQFYYEITQQIMELNQNNEDSKFHTKALFSSKAVDEILNYFHCTLNIGKEHNDILTRLCAKSLFTAISTIINRSKKNTAQPGSHLINIIRNDQLKENLKLSPGSFIQLYWLSSQLTISIARSLFKLFISDISTFSTYEKSYQLINEHLQVTIQCLTVELNLFQALSIETEEVKLSIEHIQSAIDQLKKLYIYSDDSHSQFLRLRSTSNNIGLFDLIENVKTKPQILKIILSKDIQNDLEELEHFSTDLASKPTNNMPLKEYIYSLHTQKKNVIMRRLQSLNIASQSKPQVYNLLFSPTFDDPNNLNNKFTVIGDRFHLPAHLLLDIYTEKHFPYLRDATAAWKKNIFANNTSNNEYKRLTPSEKNHILEKLPKGATVFKKLIMSNHDNSTLSMLIQFHQEMGRLVSLEKVSDSDFIDSIPQHLDDSEKDCIKQLFTNVPCDLSKYNDCIHFYNWLSLYIELETRIKHQQDCSKYLKKGLNAISEKLKTELDEGNHQNSTPFSRLNTSPFVNRLLSINSTDLLNSLMQTLCTEGNFHFDTEEYNIPFILKNLYDVYVQLRHENKQRLPFMNSGDQIQYLFLSYNQPLAEQHSESVTLIQNITYSHELPELFTLLLSETSSECSSVTHTTAFFTSLSKTQATPGANKSILKLIQTIHSQLTEVIDSRNITQPVFNPMSTFNQNSPSSYDDELANIFNDDDELANIFNDDDEPADTFNDDDEPADTFNDDDEPDNTFNDDDEPDNTFNDDDEPADTFNDDDEPDDTFNDDDESDDTFNDDDESADILNHDDESADILNHDDVQLLEFILNNTGPGSPN